jgi:hypothetical protein
MRGSLCPGGVVVQESMFSRHLRSCIAVVREPELLNLQER